MWVHVTVWEGLGQRTVSGLLGREVVLGKHHSGRPCLRFGDQWVLSGSLSPHRLLASSAQADSVILLRGQNCRF